MRTCYSIIALIIVSLCSTGFSNEWHGTVVGGQNTDWYNPLNWGDGHVPTAAETATWRYAADQGNYHSIVINGGTAVSATSSCGVWYIGVAKFSLINGAVYNVSGGLNIYTSANDAAHSPADLIFDVNNGSIVNATGEIQIGRKTVAGSTILSNVTVNINGSGSSINAGGYVWMGWGNNQTAVTKVNLTNGGRLSCDTTAGLAFQNDTANGIKPVINIAGGTLRIKGDRRGSVSGTYIPNGNIVAYNGEGTLNVAYDGTYTVVTSTPPVVPPTPPTISSTSVVTNFFDDFEQRSIPIVGLVNVCGDPLIADKPLIGSNWQNIAYYAAGALIDCTIAKSGSQSASLYRPDTESTVTDVAVPTAPFYYRKGYTLRFEHDVYIPAGSSASFFVNIGNNHNNVGWIVQNGGFSFADGVNPGVALGKACPVDQWFHMRLDIYDNNSVWMWYTPQNGNETLIDANRPCLPESGWAVRSQISPSDIAKVVYFDNVKTQFIDNTPQGYPVIHPATHTITVNGAINTATEWAGVKKVAYKPVGSKGNFNPVWPAGWYQGLANNTTVDVYMGYDSSFFYVAIDGTNITSGAGTNDGRVEAVFTWDYDDVEPTVSYDFAQTAHAASSLPAHLNISKSVNYDPTVAVDFNDFTLKGGQMAYTVSGGRIQAEFKIPFAFLPEFTGIEAAKRLNVQFNYIEQQTGDHRATTNAIGSLVPDTSYAGQKRVAPLKAGVAFAGDFNGDCKIDYKDLAAYVQTWLTTGSEADIVGGDGSNNLFDLAKFGAKWMTSGLCD